MAYGACDTPESPCPRRITYLIGEDGSIIEALATTDPKEQAEAILRMLP